MSRQKKPAYVPSQPFWGLDGASFKLLRAQMNLAGGQARLEVRLVPKAGEPDGLTFYVYDPRQPVDRANAVVNDTWHCPPFCRGV